MSARSSVHECPARATRAFRPLRWLGYVFVFVLCARGMIAFAVDALIASADVYLTDVTPGPEWTAFQQRVDQMLVADRDSSLFLATNVDDRSSWIRLAPTDTSVNGAIEWVAANRLRIPASYRRGCRTRIDDVEIEWASR